MNQVEPSSSVWVHMVVRDIFEVTFYRQEGFNFTQHFIYLIIPKLRMKEQHYFIHNKPEYTLTSIPDKAKLLYAFLVTCNAEEELPKVRNI